MMSAAATTPRAEAKRAQIRAAAQQLFVQHGFEGATTDAIAAAAGVSKQTLYRYYPSKEELLSDILGGLSVQNFWSDAEATMRTLDSRAGLEAALTGVALGISGHATDATFLGLERTLIAEIPRFPHLARRFRETVTEPGSGIVLSLLERAHAAGVVRDPPSEAAVRLFLGAMVSYIYLDGLLTAPEDRRQPDPAAIRAIVRLFLDAVT